MWPKRKETADRLDAALAEYSVKRLPGVQSAAARAALAMQMVASLRRLEFTGLIRRRDISPERADPQTSSFDPERAAAWHARNGRLDEAFWLVLLATHFGKTVRHGWKRVQDVYSGLGNQPWTWARVSADPAAFCAWLRQNRKRIGGGFGNHRKYEALSADWTLGTAEVVMSYLEWVGPAKSHAKLVANLVRSGGNDPHKIFDQFYRSMKVKRFGRLGKFDFLALVGRLELAPIVPGIPYLKGATGPLKGARLLFGGSEDADLKEGALEQWIQELDSVLNVGMQVMEDSLCNWQKSPNKFIHFRG